MLDLLMRILNPTHRAPTSKDVIKALKRLRFNGPDKDALHNGICEQVMSDLYHRGILDDDGVDKELIYIMMVPAFKSWEKFSGNAHYPVPSTVGADPFLAFHLTDNKWIGEYGNLRRELLDHMIAYFQNK